MAKFPKAVVDMVSDPPSLAWLKELKEVTRLLRIQMADRHLGVADKVSGRCAAEMCWCSPDLVPWRGAADK